MDIVGSVFKGLAKAAGSLAKAWGSTFAKGGWIGRLVLVAVTLAGLACACLTAATGTVMTGQAVGLIPRATSTATGPFGQSTQIVPITETPGVDATSTAEQPTAAQPTRTTAATSTHQSTATARPVSATPQPPTATAAIAALTDTPVPPALVPDTATAPAPVVVDTATAPPPPPTETAPAALGARVVIIAVNKREEYVDIQNQGDQAQDLGGWVLRSERGSQDCGLGGVLDAGATLRIWAMSGPGGFSCNFGDNIWNNDESDPAVLYNNQGQEVSRR